MTNTYDSIPQTLTRSQLDDIIATENYPDALFIEGQRLLPDKVVLETGESVWRVYVTDERAQPFKRTVREFASESDAMRHMLLKLQQTQQARAAMAELRASNNG